MHKKMVCSSKLMVIQEKAIALKHAVEDFE